jgi:two-component system invasion response regulator UvrY
LGIVDDHAIVRAGLKEFLTLNDDIQVVGEAASGREAIELVREVPMDVLIMDLAMPQKSGIDVLVSIRAKDPDLAVLILTGQPEETYALNLLRLGASGFLNKAVAPLEILEAVRVVGTGRRYLSPKVKALLAEEFENSRPVALHEAFTQREFQVFLKLARGESVKAIASDLFLSPKTVSTHRTNLLRKLGLASNSGLTHYAIRQRLLD